MSLAIVWNGVECVLRHVVPVGLKARPTLSLALDAIAHWLQCAITGDMSSVTSVGTSRYVIVNNAVRRSHPNLLVKPAV
jgi:hypothetical protein